MCTIVSIIKERHSVNLHHVGAGLYLGLEICIYEGGESALMFTMGHGWVHLDNALSIPALWYGTRITLAESKAYAYTGDDCVRLAMQLIDAEDPMKSAARNLFIEHLGDDYHTIMNKEMPIAEYERYRRLFEKHGIDYIK